MDADRLPFMDSSLPMPATEASHPNPPLGQPALLVERSISPIEHSVAGIGVPVARSDRSKYASPAPPASSSMTPPPSTQVPSSRLMDRTPTPPTPQLTSTPPATGHFSQPGPVSEAAAVTFTKDQIADANPDELRSMVDELAGALKEARMTAAHHKLQYNMLCLESAESQKRMAVELVMAQKENEVLQQAVEEQQRERLVSPVHPPEPSVNPANAILINELNRSVQALQHDNAMLEDMLSESRRVLEHRDGELKTALEENDRLRGRIRKNREHMNSLLENSQDGSPTRMRSILGTPVTPRYRPQPHPSMGNSLNRRDQQPFEALLLADKVLSQETATAPSTPTKAGNRNRFSHTRGTHSMSSLPSTPQRSRNQPMNAALLKTPPNHASNSRVPMSAPSNQPYGAQQRVRRDSSASTITASSAENAYSDDEVPESQASREASSLLRKTPHNSFESLQNIGEPHQRRIFGQVTKPGVPRSAEQEKRRLSGRDPIMTSPSKKSKFSDRAGLGIGGIANPRG
ncbi:hypothetical protein EJ05DRAFT_473774 [Pseudovirgaria hyperparasitica]|uniref:Uncharacterized protein n=1 Tax=Pseudovirgaria hyperparasitica TaxID=470096 RepID=A0A6A6WGY2_9PEZI|nr:uncharacterized protein EJ05DRAFT_473774 [Pseudovirgaria hyperparasitica]KAF2761236.1 hypothetical protein EJ05DRAFT_473774 [Pseudovirgaria hyperparasitica]